MKIVFYLATLIASFAVVMNAAELMKQKRAETVEAHESEIQRVNAFKPAPMLNQVMPPAIPVEKVQPAPMISLPAEETTPRGEAYTQKPEQFPPETLQVLTSAIKWAPMVDAVMYANEKLEAEAAEKERLRSEYQQRLRDRKEYATVMKGRIVNRIQARAATSRRVPVVTGRTAKSMTVKNPLQRTTRGCNTSCRSMAY